MAVCTLQALQPDEELPAAGAGHDLPVVRLPVHSACLLPAAIIAPACSAQDQCTPRLQHVLTFHLQLLKPLPSLCSAHLQLAPKMRSTNSLVASMTGRAEVTHFAIAGRVAVGLHLFSRTPGIRGVDFSFLEPPTLDVQVSVCCVFCLTALQAYRARMAVGLMTSKGRSDVQLLDHAVFAAGRRQRGLRRHRSAGRAGDFAGVLPPLALPSLHYTHTGVLKPHQSTCTSVLTA